VSDAPDHAPTPRGSLRERYAGAETLDAFIARARHYPQLWRDMRARARVPDDLVDRARRLEAPRHLLALLEDWCGDAINTIPASPRSSTPSPVSSSACSRGTRTRT
jgi:hypothetical protein